jgi:hypothetical protein
MADITVDRLVVLIEAQTRSFESQIKRLEGNVNTSTRRMASSFGALNKQMAASGSVLGRVFGIPGIGRGGAVGAIAAAVYGVNRLANSMGDLRKAARDAGIAIDEATLQSAEKFNDAWDESFQRLSVNFRKYLAGGFPGGFGQFFKETAGNFRGAPHTMTGTKADLLPQSHDFTAWDEADRVIEDLTKSFEKLRDASNEAAQGMTDSVRDFTHAIMDNPKDITGALTSMLKGVSSDIVDAGLFGTGPYAKLAGTAGPGSGGPGGLIGDAFGSLLGNRAFGNGNTPVPVTIVGTSNTVATQLIPSLLGGKDQSRILGAGATPYGALNAIAPGPAAAAASGGGYSNLIAEAAAKYGVSPALLSAMMQNESAGNPNAVSPAGAQGLMQLMPGTAKDLGVTDPFDPRQSIMGGAQYLSQMLKLSGGDTASALARYNEGPGNFAKGGMSSLPPETASYIAKILAMLPGFASGGNFDGSHPIWAGEHGRELIVPSAPGTVIPHGGAMGGRDVQIFDQRTNAPAIHRQRGPNGNMQLFIRDAMDASIKAGNHDKAMQSRYGAKPAQVGRT